MSAFWERMGGEGEPFLELAKRFSFPPHKKILNLTNSKNQPACAIILQIVQTKTANRDCLVLLRIRT